jgi:hypothetical protein
MLRAIFVLVVTTSSCFATSYTKPERHDVFSHNRAFVLDVNPKTEVHTVYDVRDRTKPLWSFSKQVWHYPFLLSNDGTVVVTVAWKHVQAEHLADAIGVRFWNRDGEFRTYPLRDLCPDPPKTKDVGVGPIGDFWRTWYFDVNDDGEAFTILTASRILTFRFADGEMVERSASRWQGREGPPEWMPVALSALAIVSFAAILCRLGRCRRSHSQS